MASLVRDPIALIWYWPQKILCSFTNVYCSQTNKQRTTVAAYSFTRKKWESIEIFSELSLYKGPVISGDELESLRLEKTSQIMKSDY